jgi:hypothetical protein
LNKPPWSWCVKRIPPTMKSRPRRVHSMHRQPPRP